MITRVAIEEVDKMVTEDGDQVGMTYFGRQVIEAATEYLKLQEGVNPTRIPVLQQFERREDMGQGRLILMLDGDSDVLVTVVNNKGQSATVEFCTRLSGGGRSPKTREALIQLCRAIQEENESAPFA